MYVLPRILRGKTIICRAVLYSFGDKSAHFGAPQGIVSCTRLWKITISGTREFVESIPDTSVAVSLTVSRTRLLQIAVSSTLE